MRGVRLFTLPPTKVQRPKAPSRPAHRSRSQARRRFPNQTAMEAAVMKHRGELLDREMDRRIELDYT